MQNFLDIKPGKSRDFNSASKKYGFAKANGVTYFFYGFYDFSSIKFVLKHFFYLSIVLIAVSFFLLGCVRQKEAVSAEIQTFTSGDLALETHADAPRKIYVDAQDADGKPFNMLQNLYSALVSQEFDIVDKPSEAGYILHVNILQTGNVNAQYFKTLVDAGYGANASFSGSGSEGLLADALLVQRRVPTAKRPSQARMKNISKRNALENSQMRIGILIPRNVADHSAALQALTLNLARTLRAALSRETLADAKKDLKEQE